MRQCLEANSWKSGGFLGADFGGKPRYREPVAFDAEARQTGKGGHRGEGMMPETLAGVNIGDVNFHSGNVRALDRVVQRNRGVRIGGGVDDDADYAPRSS